LDLTAKTLEELPIMIIDGDRGANYPKQHEFFSNEYCLFLSTKNVPGIKFDFSEIQFIDKKKDELLRSGKLQRGDIVFTTRGTIGNLAFYDDNVSYDHIRINSGMIIFRCLDGIDNYFFYSYLQEKNFKKQLEGFLSGSAQPQLPIRDMKQIVFDIPNEIIQKKIGSFIRDLDSKISNLKNQNHTLEQTAQAIFQSWFVDFDGVTEFEDSELGKIPKGWSVEKINDICETFGGGTPSTKNPNYWNGQNHWLVPRDLTSSDRMFCVDSERKITDEGLQNCASQMHPENSIFMTSRATIGAFCINKIPVATNQGFIVSRPKNPNHFYYIFLNYRNRVDEFIREANGSTFLEISRGNFRQLSILVPSPEIIDDFQTKAKLLFENIFNNEEMIVGLTKTRDALLPKLMSGEIRV
jgi:type I restriction enzyme, S subunit